MKINEQILPVSEMATSKFGWQLITKHMLIRGQSFKPPNTRPIKLKSLSETEQKAITNNPKILIKNNFVSQLKVKKSVTLIWIWWML